MRRAMETRAVIEQAKGILIAQQHCTPEQAFELLTRLSQTTHRKLRDCAADLVTSTAEDRPRLVTAATSSACCRRPAVPAGTASATTWSSPSCRPTPRPLRDTATIAFVILPVVMSGYRSGPRWLMALADCGAAEVFGAFDAGIR